MDTCWNITHFLSIFLYTKAVQLWDCMKIRDFQFHLVFKLLKATALVTCTFFFALGGMMIGGIAGAIKGQTTETGLCRGSAIGVLSGAVVAVELVDSIFNGHFLSKVALFGSIFNGKAFREWVSPAVLKAYQWQTSMNEINGHDISGMIIFNIDEIQGMSPELIKKLTVINYHCDSPVCCTICLQELMEGERARVLPSCGHLFHLPCIDAWLVRNSSCPVCRHRVDSTEIVIE